MAVMIGIDPHKRSHTAVALDGADTVLGQLRITADRRQLDALLRFAAAWPERVWAVENANGLGRLLSRQLLDAGETVVDVPAKLAVRVRTLSGAGHKTDAHDARSTAVAGRYATRLQPMSARPASCRASPAPAGWRSGGSRSASAWRASTASRSSPSPSVRSGRVIDLDRRTVEALRELRRLHDEERRLFGEVFQTEFGRVKCREDGRYVRPDYISTLFQKAVEEAGVPRIRIHDLRGTPTPRRCSSTACPRSCPSASVTTRSPSRSTPTRISHPGCRVQPHSWSPTRCSARRRRPPRR